MTLLCNRELKSPLSHFQVTFICFLACLCIMSARRRNRVNPGDLPPSISDTSSTSSEFSVSKQPPIKKRKLNFPQNENIRISQQIPIKNRDFQDITLKPSTDTQNGRKFGLNLIHSFTIRLDSRQNQLCFTMYHIPQILAPQPSTSNTL